MSQQHPVSELTASAMSNLRTLVDVNTIIGDPITTSGGTVIIPVSKVSFGYGSGGADIPSQTPDRFGGGTGGGVTIQPLAFLVISDQKVELLQLQTADNTSDRIVNAVPGLIDKLASLIPHKDKKGKEKAEEKTEENPETASPEE